MFSNYKKNIKAGQDALDPDMKRARIEHKAKMLEGNPETDNDILKEAEDKAHDSHFKGLTETDMPGILD